MKERILFGEFQRPDGCCESGPNGKVTASGVCLVKASSSNETRVPRDRLRICLNPKMVLFFCRAKWVVPRSEFVPEAQASGFFSARLPEGHTGRE